MDGAPPPEEDFSGIPIGERLVHKNWKARVHGYEALVKVFQATASEDDPAFRPYISNSDLLKKIATDANAVAQEKGLEAILALVEFAGESAARTRDAVIPALVDKCYGSARAGTKTKAIELTLRYVEIDNGGEAIVCQAAEDSVGHSHCPAAYGPKVVPPKMVLKNLPKIFGHTDKNVRAEGTGLTQALYTYLGPALQPFLSELKPVQIKELTEGFEALDKESKGQGTGAQTRWTKAQARERQAAAERAEEAEEAGGDGGGEPEAAIDPMDFIEAADIMPKVPNNFQEAMGSSKWKDRKEALDALLEVLKATPKVADSDGHGELAKALAKRMSDANIMCVIAAANCIEALAKGVGKSFGRHRASLINPMLERLKERKANVTDAIGSGLDAVFATTTLPEVTEDILNSLKSKNPQVKEGTLKFLNRSLATTRIPPAKDDVKPLSTQLAALLEDSDEKVRTGAAEGLGLTMKIVGERALNPVMESMDDIRKAKVKEAFEKAQVKCKATAAPPPKPPPAAVAPPKKKKAAPPPKPDMVFDDVPPKDSPAKKPDIIEEMAPPKAKVPARFLKKGPAAAAEKPPAEKSTAPAPAASKKLPPAVTAASAKSAKATPAAATDTFKYKFTPEDADARSSELIPAQIQTDLSDAQWKARLAALEEMSTWLDGELSGDGVESELVFRFLGKKPGWNEKNFQVSAKVYALMAMLAERSSTFSKGSAALAIPHLAEKLGDAKLKKPAGDLLSTFAEKTSLSFVLSQAYDSISKQKAPKVVADSLTWVKQALTDFGIAGLSMRSLIDFLKTCLQNSNAAVRSSATATLVTVRLFAGTAIKDFMEDLNPQLLATIDSEFSKVDGQSPPEPTRFSADVAAAPTSGSAGGGGGDVMDELFPRVDLDKLVGATSIVTDAKSDQWKVRKEALELLQSILDTKANQRLKPNMGEIGQVLKARVADTNKVVQALALDIITRISNGMNKPFEKYTKLLTLPVATVLSDQKANVRALGVSTLNAMATACEGLDSMCGSLGTALETGNPVQRGALLGWLADWFKTHEPSTSLDLTSWASPIVLCLEDRNADVRKGAQAVLPIVIARAGYDYVLNQTNSLKPASRSTVLPLIQAARGSAAAAAPAAPVAPAARPTTKPAVKVAPAAAKVAAAVESPPASPAQSGAPKSAISGRAPGGTGRRMMPLNAAARTDSRAETEERPGSSASIRAPLKAGALKRPAAPAKAVTPVASGSAPFVTASMEAKNSRLAKDGSKWVIESGPTRKDLVDMLQHQMEPHVSKELLNYLFSHDHNAVNDYITGLGILADAFADGISGDERLGLPIDDLKAMLLANQDLALKYASLRVHEPQPNLIVRCVDVVDQVLAFMSAEKYMMPDNEALAFVPTYIHKLGDAREAVRIRVQGIIQNLQLVFPTSRLFSILLEHGTRSKVAKTRQGTLDELASILKKSGIRACDPAKAFPAIASLISDKDPYVRKSTLTVIAEGYVLVGDKIWKYLGPLSGKDKTQVEERLRRTTTLAQPPSPAKPEVAPVPAIARLTGGAPRAGSPGPGLRYGGIPRPASPAVSTRAANPSSPTHSTRPHSPAALSTVGRPSSPTTSKLPQTLGAGPSSPVRSKGLMPPSRLSLPRTKGNSLRQTDLEPRPESVANGNRPEIGSLQGNETSSLEDVTKIISNILSNDPGRSVDALKAIQNVLEVPSDQAPLSKGFRDLADHTEGLVETIVIQMSQTFERTEDVHNPATYRLMKHLIQTCNAICDHAVLLESLSVDSLQSLLEELTMRLLQTDDTRDQKVKDLSRFLNMVILRLFNTGRKISVLRALFNLLLQLTKPFPANGTTGDAKEAKVAELVLKCVWKLARNIPTDLQKGAIDPIELLPALETFLQTIPPNDWRQRSANKVPCGDMPLRTIKVIIQHIVAHYADEVYELLSAAFDDPSATIIYPYVFRILNSAEKQLASESGRPRSGTNGSTRSVSPDRQLARPPTSFYPPTSNGASSIAPTHYQPGARSSSANSRSPSLNGGGGFQGPPIEEPDPDARLDEILGHISSETTGALHKEGITELHHFLKAHPHKKARVDQLLDQTGPSFRKYIYRALASRAAEDEERNSAVAETLNRLESVRRERDSVPSSPTNRSMTSSRRISGGPEYPQADEALSRLHNIFNYHSKPTNGSHRPTSSVTTLGGHGIYPSHDIKPTTPPPS
ncbi:Microtubule associated protein, partial [Rhizoctonia solani]